MTNEILLDEIKFGDHRGDEFPQPINPDAEYNEVKKQFTDRGWKINGLDRDELIELSQNETADVNLVKISLPGDDKFVI